MAGKLKYDLTDMVFEHWKAIRYLGKSDWECQCSQCGRTRAVAGYFLMNGPVPRCECQVAKKNSWVGREFFDWTVVGDEGHSKVTCRCSCGTIREVSRMDLKYGKSTSCGHSKKRADLLKKRFGDWEVVGYDEEKRRWKCQCKCGHVSWMATGVITSQTGYVCRHNDPDGKTFQDLTDKDFHSWHVICRADPPRRGGASMWKCQCECGTVRDVSGYMLRMGLSRSCGCKANELRRETCLDRYGVSAVPQIGTERSKSQLNMVSSKENLRSTIENCFSAGAPTTHELSLLLGLDRASTMIYLHKYGCGTPSKGRPAESKPL